MFYSDIVIDTDEKIGNLMFEFTENRVFSGKITILWFCTTDFPLI